MGRTGWTRRTCRHVLLLLLIELPHRHLVFAQMEQDLRLRDEKLQCKAASACWKVAYSDPDCRDSLGLVITHHTSHITHHASRITHHTSHITHHTSHVTHHTLNVTLTAAPSQAQLALATVARLDSLQSHVTRHTSHITRHTSHITHHTSHITRHTSHVTRHTSHVTRHTSHITHSGVCCCAAASAAAAGAGRRWFHHHVWEAGVTCDV